MNSLYNLLLQFVLESFYFQEPSYMFYFIQLNIFKVMINIYINHKKTSFSQTSIRYSRASNKIRLCSQSHCKLSYNHVRKKFIRKSTFYKQTITVVYIYLLTVYLRYLSKPELKYKRKSGQYIIKNIIRRTTTPTTAIWNSPISTWFNP